VGDRSYDGHAIAYRPLVEDVPRQAVVIAYSKGVKLTRAARTALGGIRDYFSGQAAELEKTVIAAK
jgi:hypothetical protein